MIVQKLNLFLQILRLLHQFIIGLLVLLTFLTEVHIGLNELVPFFLQLRFPFQHFGPYLFFVGRIFEFVQLPLLLNEFLLILVEKCFLFRFEMIDQLFIEILDHVIQFLLGLHDSWSFLLFWLFLPIGWISFLWWFLWRILRCLLVYPVRLPYWIILDVHWYKLCTKLIKLLYS